MQTTWSPHCILQGCCPLETRNVEVPPYNQNTEMQEGIVRE